MTPDGRYPDAPARLSRQTIRHRPTIKEIVMKVTPLHISLVATLLAVPSCKKQVEIRQDTPQATVATLIKLYAAGGRTRVALVVDPAWMRMDAREDACIPALLEETRQTLADAKCMQLAASGFHDPGCHFTHVSHVTDCTCGPNGNAAASKAADFLSSDFNASFQLEGLSPTACQIADAVDLDAKAVQKLYFNFWQTACNDVAKTDPFASVTVSCTARGRGLLVLEFILHRAGPKWAVVGLAQDTRDALSERLAAVRSSAAASARSRELNKDLK
jgi:hypothetical protein